MSLDFCRIEVDHYTYFYNYDDGSFYILLLYMDDIIMIGNGMCRIPMLKAQLAEKFDMKDLKTLSQILSIKILQERKDRKL